MYCTVAAYWQHTTYTYDVETNIRNGFFISSSLVLCLVLHRTWMCIIFRFYICSFETKRRRSNWLTHCVSLIWIKYYCLHLSVLQYARWPVRACVCLWNCVGAVSESGILKFWRSMLVVEFVGIFFFLLSPTLCCMQFNTIIMFASHAHSSMPLSSFVCLFLPPFLLFPPPGSCHIFPIFACLETENEFVRECLDSRR